MAQTPRQPQPSDPSPAERKDGDATHSGRGASTALARMKQWERGRAELRAARGRDKPDER